MQARKIVAFKSASTKEWTAERLEKLSRQEIEQLQENARRLGSDAILALCGAALRSRPSARRAASEPGRHKGRLVSRASAFAARGVRLDDAASWGGVRKDGRVVLALWASAVQSAGGGCSYLLWAPNIAGSRPWSDTPAGKQRLEHCKLSLGKEADGLLVYGDRIPGLQPELKARSIHGIDLDVVLTFKVEQRGEECWAAWGKGEAARSVNVVAAAP
jgi:hypothetical protein